MRNLEYLKHLLRVKDFLLMFGEGFVQLEELVYPYLRMILTDGTVVDVEQTSITSSVISSALNSVLPGLTKHSITKVIIGENITNIDASAFQSCSNLEEVILASPGTVGLYAFADNNKLTTVKIEKGVTTIGQNMFSNNPNLETVNISNSVTSIGNYAFSGCIGLESVTIPNSVTSIGEDAFENCRGLTSVDIPNSVTSIGNYAFADCRGLTSVTIGNSVTSINGYAFEYCIGLISITCNAITPPILGKGAIPNNVTAIRVPSESVNAYKSASGWSSYSSKIQAI